MTRVMLDTCVLIALVKQADSYHQKALECIRVALKNNYLLFVSPIDLSEFCVKHSVEQLLPLFGIKVLPFAEKHAKKAGELHRISKESSDSSSRIFLKNDTRIIAQAHEDGIDFLLSFDEQVNKHMSMWRKDGYIEKVYSVRTDVETIDESCFTLPLELFD